MSEDGRTLDIETRYIPDPTFNSHGLDYIEHLGGVAWPDAPPPPRRHKCWPQTRGYVKGHVARCACGAISLDSPLEVKHYGGRHWMERCQVVATPPPRWWQFWRSRSRELMSRR